MKTLIDSSAWIEFFSAGPKANRIEKFLKPPHKPILSSIVTYEVYKKIKAIKGEVIAVTLLAQMEKISHEIIPLDQTLAMAAADLSLDHKIPMADAIVYATAKLADATLITLDAHFKDLPGVNIF